MISLFIQTSNDIGPGLTQTDIESNDHNHPKRERERKRKREKEKAKSVIETCLTKCRGLSAFCAVPEQSKNKPGPNAKVQCCGHFGTFA
jgi:hypothetical protein